MDLLLPGFTVSHVAPASPTWALYLGARDLAQFFLLFRWIKLRH